MSTDTTTIVATTARVRPQIRPHFQVAVVPPKTVYLIAEKQNHVLTGGLYCTLVPLLDGTRSLEELYATVAPEVPADHVDYVLDRLDEKGYLCEAVPTLDTGVAAFWSSLGINPTLAAEYQAEWHIRLLTVGQVDAQPLAQALETMGLSITMHEGSPVAPGPEAKELWVVLTDDFLRSSLRTLNQAALQHQVPWVMVKPVGAELWISPIFQPGETACWQCLAHRIQGHEKVRLSVWQQQATQVQQQGKSIANDIIPLAKVTLPQAQDVAAGLLVPQLSQWLITETLRQRGQYKPGKMKAILTTLDYKKLEVKRHVVVKRPQCPACGDAQYMTKQGLAPVALQPCPKKFDADGGHRAHSPEVTVARYEHLVSPISGVISRLARVSKSDNPWVHNYITEHAYFDRSATLGGLRNALGSKSGGKGKTDLQSKASGLCEGLERYSGFYQGDEPRKKASFAALGEAAISVQDMDLYSERQFEAQAQKPNGLMPLPDDLEIEWSPVWSLTHQTTKYVATGLCYYGYNDPTARKYLRAHSNGNAAGNTLEEAILQGFLEVVERDAIGIWWFNRLNYRGIDLASFQVPYFDQLQAYYQQRNREIWVLDITTDFGIPVCVALSRRTDGGPECIIVGFGAHLSPALAVERALTEMNQIGLAYDDEVQTKGVDSKAIRDKLKDWFINGTIAAYPFLKPTGPDKHADEYAVAFEHPDIREEVNWCVARAAELGLETLVLNQTRPDLGLAVAKVIIPNTCLHWARLGPGRLYEVPVTMGWRNTPHKEEELNPMGLPWA